MTHSQDSTTTGSGTALGLTQRPRALLLDAGDTLLFLDGAAVSDALTKLGEQVPADAIERALHPAKRKYQQHLVDGHSHEDGWTLLVRNMLQGAGVEAQRIESLLPDLRRAHDEFYFWRRVPGGLVAALERAHAGGIRTGIISNSEGRLLSVLDRLGIADQFEHVIDSHLEGVQKPDREIFEIALERHGLEAGDCLYAGDIPEVDVYGARAAGLHGALIDAWDDYAQRDDVPRFRSVEALIDHLLTLPARA